MPTKKTAKTWKPAKTAKTAMKNNIDKIRELEAQKVKIDADIEALRKLTDTPAKLADCMVQRRNILFIDFECYGVPPKECDCPKIDVSSSLDFTSKDEFDSQCSGTFDLCKSNSIDEAIYVAEQVIRTATDLRAKLVEAKSNGCEYVVNTGYVSPENFDFHDEDK